MLNKKRNNVLKQDKVGEDFEMVQKQQIKEDVENIGLSFEDLSSDSYTYKKLGLKAGEYVATYLPELFSGASKIASYIGDYSGKTSDCMNQAKHEDKNLVVCVLGTIFSAVSVIAIVGSFASEQVYKVVRPLGDCVSSNLKNIHNAEGYRHTQAMMQGCSQ